MKRTTTRKRTAILARSARKTVSVLACFALAFSMLGIPAFADENANEEAPAVEEAATSKEAAGSDANAEPESSGVDLNPGWTLVSEESEGASQNEGAEGGLEGEESVVPNPDEITPVEEVELLEDASPVSNIVNVEIVDAKIFPGFKDTPFAVRLFGDAGSYSDAKVLKDATDESHRASFTMRDVAPGDYTLRITADRYKTYEQPLYVKDDGAHSYRVRIYTWAYEPVADDFYPGVMFYGDVNRDGDINDVDVESMVDALFAGTDDDLANHNLTGREATTLADLLVLSDAVGREAVQSSTQRSALANPVTPPPSGENLPNVTISDNVTTIEDDTSLSEFTDVIGNPNAEMALKLQAEEVISESNPLNIQLNNLDALLAQPGEDGQPSEPSLFEGLNIKPPLQTLEDGTVSTEPHPHAITEGSVLVTFDENGEEVTQEVTFRKDGSEPVLENLARSLGLLPQKAYALTPMMATVNADGSIEINFGRRIAVKRVTLRVTKTADGLNLAEISTVEFLNDMENKVDAPEMNIPEGLQAVPASKSFTVSWNRETGVTGYEISVENGGIEQVYPTRSTSMTITSFKGGVKGKIQNGVTYNVKVQSTNGNWKSGWSEVITVTPKATKIPDAPENVQAVGNYRMVNVSWKAMEDTDFYNVYYRVKDDANPNGVWEKIGNINGSSCTIPDLADETSYQIHVKGQNDIGESQPSAMVAARTTSINPASLPQYQKIPVSNIRSSKVIQGSVHYPDGTANSDGMALFDDSYETYFQIEDWDYGVTHHHDWGIQVEFNGVQDLGYISFAAAVTDWPLGGMRVTYVDETGAQKTISGVGYYSRSCENGRRYVMASLGEGVKAQSVRIGLQNKDIKRYINVAEINFHGTDGILRDINALYTDEMHIQLVDGVTQQMLDDLQARLDAPDPVSGEQNPLKSVLQVDLDYAKQLFADAAGAQDAIVQVHTDLSTRADDGKNLNFGGLNAWQPLGKAVAAEQDVIIYVTSPSYRNGSTSQIELLVGQQNGESSKAPAVERTLKTGRNVVPIPKRTTHDVATTGAENGGQLYVQYKGTNPAEKWAVRVLGAAELPTLDLYGVTDPAVKQQRAEKYVDALAARSSELSAVAADKDAHIALHRECPMVQDNANIAGSYSRTGCILNATEVMTDRILFSVAATRVHSALGAGSSTQDRAQQLLQAIEGTDQAMDLFYQHKGLMTQTSATGTIAKTNQAPVRHLNIRMMTMFAGAFMYAAGNHIGVGYGQCAEFCGLKPFTDGSEGRYFGWGTAHEIGHNINDGAYSIAEVTNNYFAQLCKTANGGGTRFDYDAVYDRVSSGEVGRTRSVAVQLAMYWQLMLAHDMLGKPSNKVYTQYGTYADLLANRFFAKVDGYSRNPGSAPTGTGTVALDLNGGEGQNIIRLASAAAEKDLRAFFASWGLVSNAETDAYVSQFPKETRALQYVSDATVSWANSNAGAAGVDGKDVIATTATEKDSKVTINITCTDEAVKAADSLVGYEVRRCRYEEGKAVSEAAGFIRAEADGSATFVDDGAAYLGNRTVWYEVQAIDKFLAWSKATPTVQCKLTGEGIYSTEGWTATTNMSSDLNRNEEEAALMLTNDPATDDGVSNEVDDDKSSCGDESVADDHDAIQDMLTGSLGRDYVGKTDAAGEAPYVLIDMHAVNPVSSVRYTPGAGTAITDYKIEASIKGLADFKTVKEGRFDFTNAPSEQVFFNGKDDEGNANPWVVVEEARYLKITATSQAQTELSINEISVFGPTGDDVDFAQIPGQEGVPAVGILDADYVLDAEKNEKIPQGSVVFTGAFKGNPAYNVVVLYDEKGTIIGAASNDATLGDLNDEFMVSHQAIFAEVPENSMIGEVSDGRWVYWIDGSAASSLAGKKVRAELYRVNNAFTNEGQRLVADTLLLEIPETLPPLHLSGGAQDAGGGESGGPTESRESTTPNGDGNE